MKTKDELIKHIADLTTEFEQIRSRIAQAKDKLAALADWRQSDVVDTPQGVFKLESVALDRYGVVQSFGTRGRKQKKDGTFGWQSQYLYSRPGEWRLLERPEKKSD